MSEPDAPEPPPLPPAEWSRARRGRPRVWTIVGVASIVVGCIAAAMNLLLVLAAVLLAFVPLPPPTVVPVGTTAAAPVAPVLGAHGLGESERAVVVHTLATLRPLSPDRLAQLDMILARAGKLIFPPGATVPSPGPNPAASIKSAVLRHGSLYGADSKQAAPDFFVTAAGRLEVYDDRAVFYPEDGSSVVRVAAASVTRTASGLTAAELDAALQQAQAACNNGMNAEQVATLRSVLSMPGQQLIVPGAGGGVRWAATAPGAAATVQFLNGSITIGPQGQVLPGGSAPAPAGLAFLPRGTILLLTGGCLGALLGVYLFISGILALRRARMSRQLHMSYALLQVPAAVIAAVGCARLSAAIPDAFAASLLRIGVWLVLLGVVYPAALLALQFAGKLPDVYSADDAVA